jgi:hypothetical protein
MSNKSKLLSEGKLYSSYLVVLILIINVWCITILKHACLPMFSDRKWIFVVKPVPGVVFLLVEAGYLVVVF